MRAACANNKLSKEIFVQILLFHKLGSSRFVLRGAFARNHRTEKTLALTKNWSWKGRTTVHARLALLAINCSFKLEISSPKTEGWEKFPRGVKTYLKLKGWNVCKFDVWHVPWLNFASFVKQRVGGHCDERRAELRENEKGLRYTAMQICICSLVRKIRWLTAPFTSLAHLFSCSQLTYHRSRHLASLSWALVTCSGHRRWTVVFWATLRNDAHLLYGLIHRTNTLH